MDSITITIGAGALLALGGLITKVIEIVIANMQSKKSGLPIPAPGGNGKVSKEVCDERWGSISMQFASMSGNIKEIKEEQKEQRQDIRRIHDTVLSIAKRG